MPTPLFWMPFRAIFPLLMEAEKIGHKAAATGFEWPDI